MELSGKQRAWLRSYAQSLDTIFQVGKGGVNENMLKQIEDALEARELIKCRVLDNCEYSAREAADGIAEAVEAEVIQVIGSRFVLFKISPTNRKYNVLEMKLIEKAPADTKKKTQAKSTGTKKSTTKNSKTYSITKRK